MLVSLVAARTLSRTFLLSLCLCIAASAQQTSTIPAPKAGPTKKRSGRWPGKSAGDSPVGTAPGLAGLEFRAAIPGG